MTLPRYGRYRDSGVEWLGEVPEHWETRRIASIFRQVDEPGEDGVPMAGIPELPLVVVVDPAKDSLKGSLVRVLQGSARLVQGLPDLGRGPLDGCPPRGLAPRCTRWFRSR